MMDDNDGPDGDDFVQDLRGDPDVGYARPPKASQFKPGQSGNPRGRPRGAKTRRFGGGGYVLHDLILAEMERLIPVRDGGQEILMPQLQAVVRQVVIKAMQGNFKAAELLLKYAAQIGRAEQRQNERFMEVVATHKAEANAEVERRIDRGITDMSDILPHPDHIDVDFATGEVLISGPMSPQERDAIEAGHDYLHMQRQALETLAALPTKGVPAEVRQLRAEARLKIEAQIRDYEAVLGVADP